MMEVILGIIADMDHDLRLLSYEVQLCSYEELTNLGLDQVFLRIEDQVIHSGEQGLCAVRVILHLLLPVR
jgi:hypothetical protein